MDGSMSVCLSVCIYVIALAHALVAYPRSPLSVSPSLTSPLLLIPQELRKSLVPPVWQAYSGLMSCLTAVIMRGSKALQDELHKYIHLLRDRCSIKGYLNQCS
jgi:hypothetical protein